MILRSILFAALIALVSYSLLVLKKTQKITHVVSFILILSEFVVFITSKIISIFLPELDEYLKVLIGWVKGIGQSNSGGESWFEFSLHSTRLTSSPEAGESWFPPVQPRTVHTGTKNTRAISWGQILLIRYVSQVYACTHHWFYFCVH